VPGLLTETTSKHGLFRLENGKVSRIESFILFDSPHLDFRKFERPLKNYKDYKCLIVNV
jgi:hypothetical protein